MDLLVLGDGEERARLESLVTELGLRSRVEFLGFCDNVWGYMKGATCLVATSRYEGFGIAIAESLAAGCPAISYDIDYGPSELIADGVNGRLVQAGDVGLVAQAMIDLWRDCSLRDRMSRAAVESMRRFGFDVAVDKYAALIRELGRRSDETAVLQGGAC